MLGIRGNFVIIGVLVATDALHDHRLRVRVHVQNTFH